MAVMQIVEDVARELNSAIDDDFVEAYMADVGHQSGDLQGEHGVDRVRGLANHENH